MAYTALYRKFRPQTFEDVKGQDHIVQTLRNQIQGERMGHAYLFTGTRGTGKTTIAKIFARAVNCENPQSGSPCGECPTCKAIASGAALNVIEIDAASNNGVDNIREIVEEVSYSPTQGKFKVYIIDEVHMLSTGAFNALLKTLEEPPAYVIFILATTEVHKIPITILSRCQRYDFRRISIDTITDRLRSLMQEENIDVEENALRYVAKTADGSMRDALSLLDQCIAFHYGSTLTYDKVLDVLGAVDTKVFSELLRYIIEQDVAQCIRLLEEMVVQGRELTQVVVDLTWYLRNLLLLKTAGSSENGGVMENLLDISADNLARLREEAGLVPVEVIMRYIRVLSELTMQMRQTGQKRVLLEMALVRLCRPEMESNKMDALWDRVRTLEKKVESGVLVAPAAAMAGQPEAQTAEPLSAEKIREMYAAQPEDVKLICQKWEGIRSSIGGPIAAWLRDMRAGAHPQDPGKLVLATADSLGYDFVREPDRLAALEETISGVVGKKVTIEVKLLENRKRLEEEHPQFAGIDMAVDIE